MDLQTMQGPKYIKFINNQSQIELALDQLQHQITIRLTSIKSRNVYQIIFNDTTLPQDLKTFLSNVKTLYQYIQINKNNNQKITIKQTGRIHLIFILAFGPQSQIKKQIIIQLQLKQIGQIQSTNIQQLGNRLRQQMIQLNIKNKQQRQKIKNIVLNVQKTNQKLVCQTQQLKLQNIQFKRKLQIVQQKLTALQFLLKDLYTKLQNLKQQKQVLQKKLQQTKLVAIVPSNSQNTNFKNQIHSIFQDSQQIPNVSNQQSYLKKIKALQDQRDQQRKNFQQKIAQKQKQLNQKIKCMQKNQPQNIKQANSQVNLLSSYLKDSEIQKLRNTVSPNNSSLKSSISSNQDLSQSNYATTQLNSTPAKKKRGMTGKYYCGGKLCKVQNCKKCKGICAQNAGQNCEQCMKLDVQKKGLKRGFLVNGNGQVSWIQNGHYCCGVGLENGTQNCGIQDKYCQWCNSLSEISQHRYKSLTFPTNQSNKN